MDFRIAQWNLGRGKVATEEAVRRCLEEGIDVLLVQEPYSRDGRVRMSNGRVFYDSRAEEIGSAILVLNDEIGVVMDARETSGPCVSARLELNGSYLHVISLYCRPSEPIEGHLTRLVDILRKKGNRNVLCGSDLNARSGLWWGGQDERGSKVEEVVVAWDLQVLNEFSRLTTFENTQGGRSNIDVTLATRDTALKVENWRVHEETLSDHRLITMDLMERPARRGVQNQVRDGSYDLRNVNWREFDQALQSGLQQLELDGSTVHEHALAITEMMRRLMEDQFPKSKRGAKKVYWWSDELGTLRMELRKRNRTWKRTGREEDRRRFVRARTEYIWGIRKQKKRMWEKLIVDEEGDPWGKVYKLMSGKFKKETLLVSLEKRDGTHTETIEETLREMLEVLLPDDRAEDDTQEQREVRNQATAESTGVDEEDFTEEELNWAVKLMKDKRAPGYDGIKSEVVKRTFGRTKGVLLDLYNKMLREGVFPEAWKEGIVKVFLKGEGKDPSKAKSYRPVTLLPVLGKIGERMVVKRIREWLERENRTSRAQFGFTEGVGTVDALLEMRREVEECREKYVVGLFLDISGAFDSAWWPEVLRVLREWRCPNNVYRLIRDYFKERKVTLKAGNGEAVKTITKGCPQGSVVGPLLWNILFDGFLRLPYEQGVSARAYADDGLLLVKANTSPDLMRKCTGTLRMVMRWGEERKLTFSKEKTVMMLLKGKLVERLIRAEMGEVRIRCSPETKYLGVVVQSGMRFGGQYAQVIDRTMKAFGKLKGLAKANNGMRCENLRRLYIGALEPMVLYGCEMWGQRMKGRGERSKLMSLQRKLLLGVTKGYSTISHEAVRVIAGIIPLDLMVEERLDRRADKVAGMDKRESKRRRREETLDKWQRRWQASTKGRETFEYVPDVRQRKRVKWETDHYTTQFVSGHGNFKAKLRGFNLVESDRCDHCGEPETAQHVLMECPFYEEERAELREFILSQQWTWEKKNFVRSREVAARFSRTCRRIGAKKHDFENDRI